MLKESMWFCVMHYSETKINEVREKVKDKYLNQFPDKMDRYYHIEGVAKLAKKLAKKNNVDESEAEIAGLVHDYYKYESNEEMAKYIDKEDLDECLACPVLFHSYSSANALKDVFGIDNPEMKSAIKNHVFGKPNMTKLEEIILISDYCEENRKYENCVKCREILLTKGIEEAIYFSTLKVIDFLKSKNIEPHHLQYEVLKEYERKINNGKN